MTYVCRRVIKMGPLLHASLRYHSESIPQHEQEPLYVYAYQSRPANTANRFPPCVESFFKLSAKGHTGRPSIPYVSSSRMNRGYVAAESNLLKLHELVLFHSVEFPNAKRVRAKQNPHFHCLALLVLSRRRFTLNCSHTTTTVAYQHLLYLTATDDASVCVFLCLPCPMLWYGVGTQQ